MEAINIPAIRGVLGNIVYYTSSFTFKQVAERVKRIDDELHTSTSLKDQLQRTLTENYKSIEKYILSQKDHFFNSLVLAVYDGEPEWNAMEVDFKGTDYYSMGFLELNGNEKIFPVDGQHRVEGIKAAIKDDPDLENETISVILIGHKKDKEGMEKTRRIFSTLNRYAKPVSTGDIIALDEDDTVAIVTRDLLESYSLFMGDKIKNSKSSKALSGENKAFTSLLTLYETNCIVYQYFKTFIDKRKKLYSKSQVAGFLKFRPEQDTIETFEKYLKSFWDLFINAFPGMKEFVSSSEKDAATKFRNSTNGGLLYFRPVALPQLVIAIMEIHLRTNKQLADCMMACAKLELNISKDPWTNILWDPEKRTMITSNPTMIHSFLIFMYDNSIMSEKEITSLKKKYGKVLKIDSQDKIDEFFEVLFTKRCS